MLLDGDLIMPHPGGRPTDYTPELAAKFCGYVATNALSLNKICAKFSELPHRTTISEWLAKYPEFRSQYLEAKENQALIVCDELWDEILECPPISEELSKFDKHFRYQQWHLSKLAPKQFGEKKQIEQSINATISHAQELKEVE